LCWGDRNLVKGFLERVGESLGITDLSSWYRVSTTQIQKAGGGGLLNNYPSLGFALKLVYPDYQWDLSRFPLRSKKAGQRWLATLMRQLLPHDTIVEDYRGHSVLKRKETNRNIELDIWIERYNLALEYQGEQHYTEIPGSLFRDLKEQQMIDNQKMALCHMNGITLVPIPYWWDGKIESLLSTLHQYLPDVFDKIDSPSIPTELPLDYKNNKKPSIRTLKKIMQGYDHKGENPEGWFMTEKLDGIRAYWDGEQFWSKNASIINVSDSFKVGLPTYPLDGELWSGYEEVDLTLFHLKQACRKIKTNIDWTKIKFCVFDAPAVEATYDKRHLFLQNNFPQYCNSNISLIPMQKCNGKVHLQKHLEEIINKGGEGIMIYNPVYLYQPGRTKNVLKVKKYFESIVIFLKLWEKSYNFLCEQENGTQSLVKCSTEFYRNPPTAGDKFLVRHLGFFSQPPRYKYPVLVEVEPVNKAVKPHKMNNIEQLKKKKKKVNKNVE
jgi:DNA ligase-1